MTEQRRPAGRSCRPFTLVRGLGAEILSRWAGRELPALPGHDRLAASSSVFTWAKGCVGKGR